MEWGKGDNKYLQRSLEDMADLKARIKSCEGPRRSGLETLYASRKQNLQKKVHHLHQLLAFYLLCHYKLVILPKFRDGEEDEEDTIAKVWDHKSFRAILEHKAKDKRFKRHCQVRYCSEEATTRTCTFCGFYNANVTIKKHLTCANCQVRVERDVNAARNIMIRFMIDKEEQRMHKTIEH